MHILHYRVLDTLHNMLTVLEHQNASIGQFYVVQKCSRFADCETSGWVTPLGSKMAHLYLTLLTRLFFLILKLLLSILCT